jgi:micrococcal nuclease|tara:strand:- start:96 stop:575 length:480 start_codon:yes stop_codon:yes gene_type:complete
MYEYRATVVNVVDGDTVDVDIDLGFGVCMKDERVRIMGIDTPESRTSDRVEDVFGEAAKARVKELLHGDCVLKTEVNKHGEDMKGKFGRILGDFIIEINDVGQPRMLTEILIAEGHAVPYHGQNKEDVAAAHLVNRTRLIENGTIDPAVVQAAQDKMDK